MRRRRRLSPAERALWEQIARTAEPLHPVPSTPAPDAPPAPATAPAPAPAPATAPARAVPPELAPFRVGEHAVPPPARRPAGAPASPAPPPPRKGPRMDARTHSRLRRGRMAPEARIDLHGMTLAQAHRALVGFILGARSSGHRLVLVITGKGRQREAGLLSPTRGLLRSQVPDWLTLPPLADLVLDVTPAHQSHGGDGALYVYLRKR